MNDWYQTLQKPPLTPPGWVFGPVWTVLYLMIGLSLFLFFRSDRTDLGTGVYLVLAVHIIANLAWTPLFFNLQSPSWALLDILILVASLIYLVLAFWQISRGASLLLWPYLLWVSFATYLNIGFVILNRT